MARSVVNTKLESLRRTLARIEAKRPPDLQTLESDIDRQDILTVNLTRAVQICVDLATHIIAESERPAPTSMGDAFDALVSLGVIDDTLADTMKRAVGFRNVAVPQYQAIDHRVVFAISTSRLGDFVTFARAVDRHVDSP